MKYDKISENDANPYIENFNNKYPARYNTEQLIALLNNYFNGTTLPDNTDEKTLPLKAEFIRANTMFQSIRNLLKYGVRTVTVSPDLSSQPTPNDYNFLAYLMRLNLDGTRAGTDPLTVGSWTTALDTYFGKSTGWNLNRGSAFKGINPDRLQNGGNIEIQCEMSGGGAGGVIYGYRVGKSADLSLKSLFGSVLQTGSNPGRIIKFNVTLNNINLTFQMSLGLGGSGATATLFSTGIYNFVLATNGGISTFDFFGSTYTAIGGGISSFISAPSSSSDIDTICPFTMSQSGFGGSSGGKSDSGDVFNGYAGNETSPIGKNGFLGGAGGSPFIRVQNSIGSQPSRIAGNGGAGYIKFKIL